VTATYPPGWYAACRRSGRGRGALVLTLGVVMIVSASVVIGLVIWRTPTSRTAPQAAGGAAADQSSPAPGETAPVGRLDVATRAARIGSATLILPEEPYRLNPDPPALEGVLDVFFWADAIVHQGYDGRHDWSAAVLFGRVSSSLAIGDPAALGQLTLTRLSQTFYGQHTTKVSRVTWSDHSVDGHPGLLTTARIEYAVAGLPSRYDEVRALLVRLDDGSMIIAVSAVPDDAEPAVVRQASDALATLHIG
jgi:hypothetical protein